MLSVDGRRHNINFLIGFPSLHGYLESNQCFPDSKIHGDNMGSIWGGEDPGGPHVGPMNFVIWVHLRDVCVVLPDS